MVSKLSLATSLCFEGDATAKLEAANDALRTIRGEQYVINAEPRALQFIAEAHLALG